MDKTNIFIISGPSGSGQDSIIEELKKYFELERVITSTTRSKRPGESDGSPYYFLSRKEFEKGIREDKFAEWAQEYNDNLYGVSREELERVSKGNKVGIWRIEYKGVITAREKFPQIKSILIAPESLEILEKRILRRDKKVDPEFLKERMKYSKEFLKHEHIYDYKVINKEGKLKEAAQKVAEIIKNNLSKNDES